MEAVIFAVGTLAPLLLILVVVHELGHFATARAIGVKVLEFGVGFPPRVFGVYTGRTQVLLHAQTRFIGLDGPQSLQSGQRVKVGSIEDEELGLIAVEIELYRNRDKEEDPSHFNRPVDHLLWHEGKVRSVNGGSFELADMLYSVNLIPLGGFVRLAGENNPTVPQSLAAKGPGSRIMVLAAGAAMNALLPLLIFTVMFMLPQDEEVGRLAVAEVLDGSPAAQAGLRPGDIFVSANGQPVENRVDLTREINLNGGSELTLLIERDRSLQTVALTPAFNTRSSQWQAGVAVDLTETQVVSRSRPLWEAIPASFTATWDLLLLLKQTVGGMISHGAAPQLSGPVGIAQMTGGNQPRGRIHRLAHRRHTAQRQPRHHQHPSLPHARRRTHRLRGHRVAAPRQARFAGERKPRPPHRPRRPGRRHRRHHRQRRKPHHRGRQLPERVGVTAAGQREGCAAAVRAAASLATLCSSTNRLARAWSRCAKAAVAASSFFS